MNAILPALAKAAAVGSVIGLSAELVLDNANGHAFTISVVSAVALRLIGASLGAGAAVGVFLGTVTALFLSLSHNTNKDAVAGALLGGALGYLAELAGPFAHVVVVL